jgi:hypothetical protein
MHSWRRERGDEPETYHLTCPVCGALPGTSCIENYPELDRVHPSRRMSVAERNRRHAATGWEPPELTERRLRERGAGDEAASQCSPLPRGRPLQVQASTRRRPSRRPARTKDVPAAGTGPQNSGKSSLAWFAAYLSGFPEHTAVPRWQLREVASTRWPGTDGGTLRLTPGRQPRTRAEGRANSSKGRPSSQHLASHLRSFEDLGLVRRDHARDLVIITDPVGLRRLAETSLEPPPGHYAGTQGTDRPPTSVLSRCFGRQPCRRARRDPPGQPNRAVEIDPHPGNYFAEITSPDPLDMRFILMQF